MAVAIVIPDLGNEIEEAEVDVWMKQSGDTVAAGELVLSITTPKLTMEIEAPAAGVLGEISVEPGDIVKVGDRVAVIDEA